jgi:hypothetical protein
VWQPIDFLSVHGEVGFVFALIERADGAAGLAVPALTGSDGTEIPAGEYTISEGLVYTDEEGGVHGNNLFGNETTVWFN